MAKSGKLFVFEGPDGVGKSTILERLAERLASDGISHVCHSFPGKEANTLGNLVYRIYHNPGSLNISNLDQTSLQVLNVAAHIDTIESKIFPAIKKGEIVLLDRYWWSTLVYGAVYGANRKSLKKMIELEKIHWKSLKPTCVFLILRSNPLLQQEVNQKEWEKLYFEYEKLANEEQEKYKVVKINNGSSITDAVNEVNEVISNADIRLKVNNGDKPQIAGKNLTVFSHLSPAKPTKVFDTYWRFASERQSIFFKRIQKMSPPWTKDKILQEYKFTNAYRASDRVSQYLIREVIYKGDRSPTEIFFRILLFKTFNKIETWKLLKDKFDSLNYAEYSFEAYDEVLTKAIKEGKSIYSAAYIMASGKSSFGFPRKHRNHLKLIETMIEEEFPQRIIGLKSMRELFEHLRSYPTIGDFLAYQYATDINYSELTDFKEMEFVVPGPGAKDGIRKCFTDLGGLNEVEIIKLMADRQFKEFERLGLKFESLWSRPLQLIDCQNLFCEVDKYARIAHPDIKGISNRKRIKQKYVMKKKNIKYWYPPKWGINETVMSKEG
jgi:thymidylate kinase